MKTGKVKAFPIDWGTSVSMNGKPFVFIDFEAEDSMITWKGFLTTEFGVENATKTLIYCGFRDESLDQLNHEDALDKEKPVQLVIEDEEYKGKTYPKVRWVNPLRSIEKKKIEGITLKDIFAESYNKMNLKPKKKAFAPTSANIPF
jgi:hypothetical protein